MEPLTIRIHADTKEALEDAAADADVSVSEHVRTLLERGREYDRLQAEADRLEDRLAAKEDRIAELEEQLARRSEIEEKIEALPDKVRGAQTYQERRQRLLDEASLAERLKWKVTGVPVNERTE